ncbi:helix-turn-helix and ligand-binding sensor domain-containing protein [Neotamlana laminarinivorans]|uniref:LuxR C-terminal-related transcriptional regulator n=1 Tax=Neotamlana laminarinivorans TaxID=2883124 RepID=A0A9X1I163_9FLAO|nr:triple tyrosine motif-containing protein [Tamlana laminarinivorans]MCB4798272.1 LuxR C-terminal-related transcriptional regulator [Tamlana laminarinivorans]
MKLIKSITVFTLIVITLKFHAQERPPIQIFSPTDYGAENQNWSIDQAANKTIYVANNTGLLEFNGAKWTVYPSPNKTIIRSVAVISNRIYTGSFREFGYWEKDAYGKLNYTSLSEQLQIPFFEDEELWNIIGIGDSILFQSLNRIYIYNALNKSVRFISTTNAITKIFKIDNSIYFQEINSGLFEILNGKANLVSNNKIFKNNTLVNIFKVNKKLVYLTEDNGFYFKKDNKYIAWNIPILDKLKDIRIYSAKQLHDGSFVLGSISNGIFILSANGNILHEINQNTGISNNTILSVFEDVNHNIWLGLENGINCINVTSPFSIYNDLKGKIGAINTSILYNNNLYIGTNQGLFFKPYNSQQDFQFIKGTQGAVWSLSIINNELFCGHNSGTFLINKDKASLIANIQGTWSIKPINNELLLQGNYTGLYVLHKVNNIWKIKNKIKNFDISSRYFEILNKNEVYVSHEYKGVFKIILNENFTEAIKILKEKSVTKGLKTSLVKYKNQLFYGHINGVFKYNNTNKLFEKDSIYSKLIDANNFTSGKLISDEVNNKLWAVSKNGLNYIETQKLTNTPKFKVLSIPSYVRSDVSGYENISYLKDETYLYGNSTGYIVFNLNKVNPKPFKIYLNKVINSDFKKPNDSLLVVNKTEKGLFKYTNNNIEFNFSVPQYQKYVVPEYQYKLEGIYNNWSQWQNKPNEFFENLPFGNYTFKVRAKIGNTISENTETYAFTIKRPWYISNTMLACYVAVIVLFSWFMHKQYQRSFKKQQKKLILKKQRQLELKELENKEELTRLNNEKLRLDIENKNRELGISTMSLIKKNQFLNNLKKELQNLNDIKSIKKVINIIDKNINNSDDWHVFEEAFNNADKDFLKKVKQLHPELTSNDLRLCTYLRLNLSSKEIAPLLNISSRSVEVKRYRLRKKMNLKHEASLTDYILQI